MALKTRANVLADTATGQRFQDSLQNRLKESGVELKRGATAQMQNALNNQIGSGKKRKQSNQSRKTPQKKRKQTTKSKPIKRNKSTKGVSSSKATKPRTFKDISG